MLGAFRRALSMPACPDEAERIRTPGQVFKYLATTSTLAGLSSM